MTGPLQTINISHQAERLVVEGLRRWMAGYATGDVSCWEMAWELYERELGPDRARKPLSDLSCYARALNTHGKRQLCLFPYDCLKCCQDECLVASLVSAAQAGDVGVLGSIGGTLVSPEGLAETLFAACEYGAALGDCGLSLEPVDLAMLSLDECPLKRLGAFKYH